MTSQTEVAQTIQFGQPQEPNTEADQQQDRPTLLAFVIRAVGFLPSASLVVALMLPNELYRDQLPGWYHSVLDQQVAILTLCAGHAGIISLLINIKGRVNFNTYALFIAAGATALAGYRAIGDSTAGHTIFITLFFSFFPAVWAEPISAAVNRVWNFVKSRKGLTIGIVVSLLILITFNQYHNENYIRNWLLIPFGILLAIIATVAFSWVVLKLAIKYIPILWAWIARRAIGTYNHLRERFHRATRKEKNELK